MPRKKRIRNRLNVKIPFNRSIKRKVVLEFESVCNELGVEQSPMLEEILLTFIKDYRKPK